MHGKCFAFITVFKLLSSIIIPTLTTIEPAALIYGNQEKEII